MSALTTDGRWQCRGCRRFLRADQIGSEDAYDDLAHYWADCPRCGRTDEPVLVPTGWRFDA